MGFHRPRGSEGSVRGGIPATAFMTKDIGSEYVRLKARRVAFRAEPKQTGSITAALCEDGRGNLIQLVQAVG